MLSSFYRFVLVFLCVSPILVHSFERDFEKAMGKNTSDWGYIVTPEDVHLLNYFKKLYEKNESFVFSQEKRETIPKVIHFVWLGPSLFPEASIKNLQSWVQKHPSWKVKFWTDVDRPTPCEGIEKCLVKDFAFLKLEPIYCRASHVLEKSEILRYEILMQQGGLYVDHDVFCLRPFDDIHERLDFYCGLENLGKTIFSSSLYPSTHLIASSPFHPVLRNCIDWIQKKKEGLLDEGSSFVKYRSTLGFIKGVKAGINTSEKRDIIFPASYFSRKDPKMAYYAFHEHGGLWKERLLQDKMESKFVFQEKKAAYLFILGGLVLFSSLAVGTLYFFQRRNGYERFM